MWPSILIATSFLLADVSAMAIAPRQDSDKKTSFCVIKPATPVQQKLRFEQFIQKLIVEKKVSEAYHEYVVEDMIQHDAFTQSGAQASIDINSMILPTADLVIYHQTFEFANSTGWVHTKASGNPFFGDQTALADLYRFDGTCIVEHWDVIQARPANATNPLSLF